MTVIGSASIDIRANDRYFEPDVRRAVAKIKNVTIDLKVNADMSAANKKLRDLRYRMAQNEVSIKIRADDSRFETDVRVAVRKIKNVQIDLKADVDVTNASKKIRDLRYRITSKDAILKIDADLAKAEEKMRKFLEKFIETEVNIYAKAHTGAAHTALTDLQTRYGKNVNFTATANTRVASAQLAHAARTRRAKILAFVDNDSRKALQGLFNTLTGTLPFDKVKKSISGVMAGFEGIVVKGSIAIAAISALGASVLTLGANIFSIVGDATQVIGITAMLPAAFIGLGTSIAASMMAWKGFKAALSEDPKAAAKAMAMLTTEAAHAANAVRGTGREIRNTTQIVFWDNMNESVEYTVEKLLPELLAGFEHLGASMGRFQAASLFSLADSFGGGVLEGILRNTGEMLDNASVGAARFISALATLGKVGATYLPAFGTSVTNAATRFDNFIKGAEESGRIHDWIDTATRRFQELGSIISDTSSIMTGLTNIARMSGAAGLTQMADGFENVANVVNSEPFKSQLRTILEGARSGVESLGAGLGTLTQVFWDSADSVSAFLALGGEIAGLTFDNIAALFDGTNLGTGLYTMLIGLRDFMKTLEPGFADLGNIIGDLGEIGAVVLTSLAPGINLLVATIDGVVSGIKQGVLDALPVFNEFAQAVMNLASGPIIFLANAIGGILSALAALPAIIQTVILSLGLLLLLRHKFIGFFSAMGQSISKEHPRINAFYQDMQKRAEVTRRATGIQAAGLGKDFAAAMSASAVAAAASTGTIHKSFSTMATGVKTTLGPIAQEVGKAIMVDGDLNRVKGKFGEMGQNIRNGFASTAVAAGMQGAVMKDRFHNAATSMGDSMRTVATKGAYAFSDLKNAAFGTVGGVSKHMGDQFHAAGQRMGDSMDKAKIRGIQSFQAVSLAAGMNGKIAEARFADMAKAVDKSLGGVGSRAATALAPLTKQVATVAQTSANHFKGMASTVAATSASAAQTSANHFKGMASTVGGHLDGLKTKGAAAFNAVSLAAGIQGGATKRHMQDMAASAATSMRDIPSYARSAFGAVTGPAVTAGNGIKSAFTSATDTIGRNFSKFAGQMSNNLAPARAAFSTLAAHATATAATAAAGMGGQLKAAGAGLAGALGGGWGVAIAGAAIAVGAWAQAQAKSKARVEELTKVVSAQGDELGAAGAKMLSTNLMDGATTKWDDFWRGAVKGSKSVEESFDILGVSVGDVGRKLADSEGRDKYTKGWQDIHDTIRLGKKPTEEMLAAVDMTSEQIARLNEADVGHINGELQAVADEAERAEIRAKQLADAMGVSGINGAALSKNYETLALATSSVSEKTSAFKQNLDIVNKGTSSALEASSKYHESLIGTNDELTAIAVAAGGSAKGLLTQAGAFDVTTTAGNDLFKTVNAHKDGIIDMGIAVMQNAINNGESISVAKAKAVESMEASKETLHKSLTDIGIDAGTANKLISEIGLDSDKLTAALVMETDAANFNIAQTALAANAYANGEYAAALSAMPKAAKDAILSVSEYAEAYRTGKWEGVLTAINDTGAVSEEVISSMIAMTDAPFMVDIAASNLTGPEFNEVMLSGDKLKLEEFKLDITTEDKTAAGLASVTDKVDTWEELATLTITALDGTQVPIGQATEDLRNNWFNSDYGQLVLRAIDETQGGVDPALFRINRFKDFVFGGVTADLTATDATEPAAGSAMSKIRNFQQEQVDAKNLFATDNSQEGINLFNTNVDSQISGNPVIQDLMTADKSDPGIESAKKKIFEGWASNPDNIINLMTNDQAQPGVVSAKNSIETGLGGIGGMGGGGGLARGISLPINVLNMAEEGTAAAANTMTTGVTDQTRGIFAINNTAGTTGEAQAGMNTLTDVQRNLLAANLVGGPVGAAQGGMNTLADVQRNLLAQNLVGGPVGAATAQIGGVKGANVDLIANDKGSQNAKNVKSAIDAIGSKTVDIVTNFWNNTFGDKHADGGVYLNPSTRVMAQGGIMKSEGRTATQTFANGGFSGINKTAVKAFAGGGIENHTAQIARGAWPVRVWAEPETGGEAYIPLSPNKRKRSLDILKIVMDEFGLGHLTHSFADGGVMPASQSPSVVSQRYTASAPSGSPQAFSSAVQSAATPIIVQVNPSAPLNEKQVGEAAARELYWQIINQ